MKLPIAAALPLSFFLISSYFTDAAETPPYANSSQYTQGELGSYLLQSFETADLIVPQINQIQRDSRCNNDLYTFLSPHLSANGLGSMQATILDNEGHLVWTTGWEGKSIYNLMVQTYKGENVLTFWAGDASSGLGSGTHYILDSSYSVLKTIGGNLNGVDVDLHEFTITANDTALATAYVPVNYTFNNGTTRLIWDCLVQEIDIETGELIFQWSAAEHIDFEDTYIDRQVKSLFEEASDWFHVNSVDKDHRGNYLVSSCFTFSLYYIDGTTGETLWILGGKRNMFEDKSEGHTISFSGQHHARWTEDYSTITLFNNDIWAGNDSQPGGLRLKIDQAAMTVDVMQEYHNPWVKRADTQGSMQDLPSGNVLVGFGSTPAWTEFSYEGQTLCETHFAPSSSFDLGVFKSYRVLQYPWRGYPTYAPTLRIARDTGHGYVSWNGATEVRAWELQESVEMDVWNTIETQPKKGFETELAIDSKYHKSYIRVIAVDESGAILGISGVVNIATTRTEHSVDMKLHVPAWVWIGIVGFGVVAVIATVMVRKRHQFQYHHLSTKDEDDSNENLSLEP